MELYNGNSDEIRSLLRIDRTPPAIRDVIVTPLYDGSDVSQLISFNTDDITKARIHISKEFDSAPAEVRELGYKANFHRIKLNESEFSGTFEFFIEAENSSGLKTREDNDGSYYTFQIENNFIWEQFTDVTWTLPPGYLLSRPTDLDNDGKLEAVLSRYNENQAFGPVEVYEFENDRFVKRLETEFKAIPRDAGDVDKDGLSDLLLGYGKNSYLYEAVSEDDFPQKLAWVDTTGFWAAGYADADNDGKNEIIGRNDSAYIVKEYISDNSFTTTASLINFTGGTNQLSVPDIELFDVDDDGIGEVIFGDYDGDLIVYKSIGDNIFQPLNSNQLINFDATSLLSGISSEFGSYFFAASHTADDLNYEHEFDARYWSIERFVPQYDVSRLTITDTVNIYGYQNLKEYDSGLVVRRFYNRLLLFAALYPNMHIFEITADKIQPIWHRPDARSNTILVADFDGNAIEEFYYNDGSQIRGFTVDIKNRPDRPNKISAQPLDSTRAEIRWNHVSGHLTISYTAIRNLRNWSLIPAKQQPF